MKQIILTVLLMFPFAVHAKDKAPTPAAAKVFTAQEAKGKVVFEAIGKPSFLKIKGQGEGPKGEVRVGETVTGTFQFKMASLDTGINLRNEHMKEKYLEVGKYPTAELKIEEVSKFDPAQPEAKALPFKGLLTIHGVTKPVSGTVDVKKKGEGFDVSADFETKITDFSMDIPAYAGVTVADSVKVSVSTELL